MTRRAGPLNLLDLSRPDLEALVVELGESSYRAGQVWRWLYRRYATSIDAMTDLSASFRERLAARAEVRLPELVRELVAEDALTRKALLRLADGEVIETVLMLYEDGDRFGRRTVCISTQVGCAVGCPFCATGQMGLVRNLTTGEIVAQALHFARELSPTLSGDDRQHPITNVVFMGMGEPMLNYDNTWRAVETLHARDGLNIGVRRMTISTSGIIPGIERLAGEALPVNLAVSLHAPNDALRNTMVPINKKYPIAALMRACRNYIERTSRRIMFEYVLNRGVNDSEAHAHELGRLLQGMLCHVNLIPVNPTDSAFKRPSRDTTLTFQRIVDSYGIATTVRVEKGVEISAACGQLKTEADA